MDGRLRDFLDAWHNWAEQYGSEVYGQIAIVSVTENAEALELRMRFPSSENAADHWIVRCEAVRNHDVHPAAITDDILLLDEHALLLEHKSDHVALYFNGKSDNARAVAGALYQAHVETIAYWYPFERFLNSEMDLVGLLESGYGKLADGPVPLVTAYERVLSESGIRATMLKPRPPVWWDGERWAPDGPGVRVLFLDDMYAVAAGFTASKA